MCMCVHVCVCMYVGVRACVCVGICTFPSPFIHYCCELNIHSLTTYTVLLICMISFLNKLLLLNVSTDFTISILFPIFHLQFNSMYFSNDISYGFNISGSLSILININVTASTAWRSG